MRQWPDLYNETAKAPTATERDGHTVRQTATATDMAEDTVPQTLYANNGRCLRIHARCGHRTCAAI